MRTHQRLIASRHLGLSAGVLLLLPAFSGCGDDPSPSSLSTGDQAASVGVGTGGAGGSGGTEIGGSGGGGGGGGEVPPPPPGIEFVDVPYPVDLGPDGRIALLQDMAGDAYFYDTVTHALEYQTSIGDPAYANAHGVSGTGRIAAAHDDPIAAGLWSEAQGWLELGNVYPMGCDAFDGGAWDISADGTIGVGMFWNGCHTEAFRWTDTGGAGELTLLDIVGESSDSGKPPSNRASVVSDDGKVIAGFAENKVATRSPVIWREDGTGFLLDEAFQDGLGEVLSISADGKVVAGVLVNEAFSWTEEGGFVMLGKPPGAAPENSTFPNAVCAGGQLIFGRHANPWETTPTAFVWTAADGMRALRDVITDSGIEVPSKFALVGVYGASADGSVVLGGAYDEGAKLVTFVLRLPVSAYGIGRP